MSMKLSVNPLVFAAALGLLGPAALAEDDDDRSMNLAGMWKRAGDAPGQATQLGARIEVLELDDQVLLDDGTSAPRHEERWTRPDETVAVQSLVIDGTPVERTFRLDGDALHVTTVVHTDLDAHDQYAETYTRIG